MDEKLQEDWLDARLRDEAPYIDDAGFSSRVIAQLPARRSRNSLRSVILLAVTVTGQRDCICCSPATDVSSWKPLLT